MFPVFFSFFDSSKCAFVRSAIVSATPSVQHLFISQFDVSLLARCIQILHFMTARTSGATRSVRLMMNNLTEKSLMCPCSIGMTHTHLTSFRKLSCYPDLNFAEPSDAYQIDWIQSRETYREVV